MEAPTRSIPKAERQRLEASLIARRRIGTQVGLLEALASSGCRVSQATVSRDVHELGLEKAEDALGRPRYVLPAAAGRRTTPAEALERVLGEFGRRATAAQSLVVLHAELGSAPAIARALDRLAHPKVVGTLAGDDTVLVVARTTREAAALARELGALMARSS
jgi:transcriptional regulator of arginine metabolism